MTTIIYVLYHLASIVFQEIIIAVGSNKR